MKKFEFLLENLGCANCAAKIERDVNSAKDIESAIVDFVSKKIIVNAQETVSKEQAIEIIKEIANKYEPDINVVTIDKQMPKSEQQFAKAELIKLVAGGVIFAIGLIFHFDKWIEFSVFLLSYLIVGGGVLLRAVKSILKGQVFSEHFLMSVATIGAFFIGEYPEGVGVMLFYLVGELFQDMAVDHSRKSISNLMNIKPEYANLSVGTEIKKVDPEQVKVGEIIIVKPGEKIPLDGIVQEGNSTVNTAALTGEAAPRELFEGSEALSGFVNIDGVISIKVTKVFQESAVSKILDLVQNASSRKAPTEQFITKFAGYYTPAVVLGALALAVIPPLVIQGATFADWIYRALVFLVVSCPCALVISIPLGFFGGIGGASKNGILVKGSNYLEALNSAKAVVFDKTGTLTKGVFKVAEINSQEKFNADEILKFAAYAESYSNHPIALSIVREYKAQIEQEQIQNYQEIAGHGISANVLNRQILIGNARLMEKFDIQYSKIDALGTALYIAVDGAFAGTIVISDEVKEDAKIAVENLKRQGIEKIIMLTGDIKAVADKFAQMLGISQVYSQLLPADKVEKIEQIQDGAGKREKVVFVGDGINDAPVLARADVGIAMGGLGSDAAIDAADIVIMTDEPSKVATAIFIAGETRKIVFQNIAFALVVKGVFLVLGACGVASMWEAVFADTGVALLAVLNAMRAMHIKG